MIDEKVLIERLEKTCAFKCVTNAEGKNVFEIIKDLASEHNNGWIPCSERLPKENQPIYATCQMKNDSENCWVAISTYKNGWNIPVVDMGGAEVLAWREYVRPAPYKKGE